MNIKTLSTLGAVLLPVVLAVPQFASADQNCEANQCQVIFEYTGSAQTWQVPEGAFNIQFELYGASGGGGASGGYTAGELVEGLESVTILVGGQGQLGETTVGGFNGGGAAGAGNSIAGSGGGATDIRLMSGLDSRVAVAGGGGGAGGPYGPIGGAGGGAAAQAASAESGQGGQGGGQAEGGAAGANDGIFRAGEAGSFGQGGGGGAAGYGSSGGGGGGWYGGGGGGGWESAYNYADVHTAGGGGGSSYASPEWTRNASLSQGVWTGNGRAVLRYQMQPEINEFAGRQLDTANIELRASATGELTPLTAEEVVISDPNCQFLSSEVVPNAVVTVVSGCQQGEIEFDLNPQNYLWRGAPIRVVLDQVGPTFEFLIQDQNMSASAISIPFSVSDDISVSAELLQIVGCTGVAIASSQVELSGCQDGPISLNLEADVFVDSFGNVGPQSPQSLLIMNDVTMPTASWSAVSITSTSPYLVQAFLSFSEPVVVGTEPLFAHSGSSCSYVSTVFNQGAALVGRCDDPHSHIMFTGAAWDLFGNPLLEVPEPLELRAQVNTESSVTSTDSESQAETTSPSSPTQSDASESMQPVESKPQPVEPEPPTSTEAALVNTPTSSPTTSSETVSQPVTTDSSIVDSSTESEQIEVIDLVEEAAVASAEEAALPDSQTINLQLAQDVSVSLAIELPSANSQESSWPLQPISQLTIPSPQVISPEPQVIRIEYPASPKEPTIATPVLERSKDQVIDQEIFFPWQFLLGLLAVLLVGTVSLRFTGR